MLFIGLDISEARSTCGGSNDLPDQTKFLGRLPPTTIENLQFLSILCKSYHSHTYSIIRLALYDPGKMVTARYLCE